MSYQKTKHFIVPVQMAHHISEPEEGRMEVATILTVMRVNVKTGKAEPFTTDELHKFECHPMDPEGKPCTLDELPEDAKETSLGILRAQAVAFAMGFRAALSALDVNPDTMEEREHGNFARPQ